MVSRSIMVSRSMKPALLRETELPRPAVLDAQTVFDELIQALAICEPALTQNPVSFFADQLDRSLPKEEATIRGTDPYRIKSAIDEMRAAANWVQEEYRRRTAAQQELHRVREYLREARYFDAIAAILKIGLKNLNQAERDDLLEMALETVESTTFSPEFSGQTLDLLRRLPEIAALATQPGIREQVARALVNNGITLGQLNRSTDALAVFEEVVRRFGEASEQGIR
jgi:tetratricopeptide (TPR) repeat protein